MARWFIVTAPESDTGMAIAIGLLAIAFVLGGIVGAVITALALA